MAIRLLGFLSIFIFFSVLWFAFMKIHNEEYEYDERQLKVQGNSYRISNWLFFIYFLVLYLSDSVFNLTSFIDFKGYMIIGLALCGCISDGYNQINGAYFYPKFKNKKKMGIIICSGFLIITWLINLKHWSGDYGLMKNGMVPNEVVLAASMVMLTVTHFVFMIINEIRERKVTE